MNTTPTIEACPHGPLLLRGVREITDGETTYRVQRPVVALCRCGGSRIRPFCDSSHKTIAKRRR